MPYFVYRIETTAQTVFACEAGSFKDADERYEKHWHIAPVKQTHIRVVQADFAEYNIAFQEFVLLCLQT